MLTTARPQPSYRRWRRFHKIDLLLSLTAVHMVNNSYIFSEFTLNAVLAFTSLKFNETAPLVLRGEGKPCVGSGREESERSRSSPFRARRPKKGNCLCCPTPTPPSSALPLRGEREGGEGGGGRGWTSLLMATTHLPTYLPPRHITAERVLPK